MNSLKTFVPIHSSEISRACVSSAAAYGLDTAVGAIRAQAVAIFYPTRFSGFKLRVPIVCSGHSVGAD